MKANAYAQLICLLLLCAVTSAWAQTSTVTIEAAEGGAATAVTTKAVELTETDYPLESLLANQEGKVTLEVSVDGAGHAVNLRLVSSSGVPLLDQKAAQLAGTRWLFQPTGGALRVTVDWKLPLEQAEDYRISTPSNPAGAVLPTAIASHAVTADDYPPLSVRGKEQGIVAVRYRIKNDGSIGEVQVAQTSGIKRIDDAAIRMISRRWKFKPATVDGKPVDWWVPAIITFELFPDMLDKRNFRCYQKPIDGADFEKVLVTGVMFIPPAQPAPMPKTVMDRWTLVNASGEVSDVLITTHDGLRRPTGALLQALKGSGYKEPDSSGECWYYDPVFVPR